MNTSELIRQLARELKISQKTARQLLEQELTAIAEHLGQGDEVVVRGFGRFTPMTRRQGRSISFRAAQKFREAVKRWRPS
jgi:nucleoid DNA-binding protein